MVKFASNFCYCAIDQEKAVFQWKRAVSGPSICPFGARNGQICFEFLLLCVDQEKPVFQWKRAVSGPSALLGPEMVRFASNFCYCAVDQEKAVFQWKRAVSGPSALFRPKMVKFAPNFFYCAVDEFEEKAVFQWKRAVSGPSALLGPEMVEFLLLCRPRKYRFSMEMCRFWPICPFGAKEASNFCYCAVDQEKAVFQWKRAVSGPSALLGPEMVKFALNFCYCV